MTVAASEHLVSCQQRFHPQNGISSLRQQQSAQTTELRELSSVVTKCTLMKMAAVKFAYAAYLFYSSGVKSVNFVNVIMWVVLWRCPSRNI